MSRKASGVFCLAVGLSLCGCIPPVPAGFTSPDPNRRLNAIVEAAQSGDQTALRPLVGQLESADAAARVLAIRTLEDLTGQTLGYDPYGPDRERQEAVESWTDWLSEVEALSYQGRRQPPRSGEVAGRQSGEAP